MKLLIFWAFFILLTCHLGYSNYEYYQKEISLINGINEESLQLQEVMRELRRMKRVTTPIGTTKRMELIQLLKYKHLRQLNIFFCLFSLNFL